jgi:hypothetical protein
MGTHKFKWQSEGAAVIDLPRTYLAGLLSITIPKSKNERGKQPSEISFGGARQNTTTGLTGDLFRLNV